MSDEARQRLLAATRRAAGEARRGQDAAESPPAPGDLYALPASADHAVEWLVAARHDAVPGRLLVVPADADPPVGSSDLEVPPADGGPLVLRCRHGRWIDAAVLADGHRGGRLGAAWPAAAAERWRAVEAGDHRGSPLERETDDDPAYRDRDRELAAAGATLDALSRAAEHGRQRRRFTSPLTSVPTLRALAAVLLVALLGVGWWALELRSELTRPRWEILPVMRTFPSAVDISSDTRSTPAEVRVDPKQARVLLELRPSGDYPTLADGYRWRLVDDDGHEVGHLDQPGMPRPGTLVIPADQVDLGSLYKLQLLEPGSGSPGVIAESPLIFVTEP